MTTARKRQREAPVDPRGDTPPVPPSTRGSSASTGAAAAASDTLESVSPCNNSKTGSDSVGKDKEAVDDSVARGGSDEVDKMPPEQRLTVCSPVVFGSCAFYLGTKLADQSQTHRWTLYVRGAYGEDLSYMLEKVVFTLHHSFDNPVRKVGYLVPG